jgi:hypothetical protein
MKASLTLFLLILFCSTATLAQNTKPDVTPVVKPGDVIHFVKGSGKWKVSSRMTATLGEQKLELFKCKWAGYHWTDTIKGDWTVVAADSQRMEITNLDKRSHTTCSYELLK